ncbi:MAG: metallophosphoesterase, partial [Tannerellaceae bacterium]|nr:metallophosphoesterase [Tannerellaceae bacterium]
MKKITLALCAALTLGSIYAQDLKLGFNGDGKFRIVQFADIHYKTGTEASTKAIGMMKRIIEAEKPDLIVFTGDNVISSPQKQGWDEILDVAIGRSIPYAVTLGNHDDEQDWTRGQIFDYIVSKPYSL